MREARHRLYSDGSTYIQRSRVFFSRGSGDIIPQIDIARLSETLLAVSNLGSTVRLPRLLGATVSRREPPENPPERGREDDRGRRDVVCVRDGRGREDMVSIMFHCHHEMEGRGRGPLGGY